MPATLEPPEKTLISDPHRPRPLARRFLISAVRFLAVLALGAMAGGGWYLAKKGFGRKWRGLVVEELHRHGVEASVRRLTLDPLRGLVAQDVRIFDYKNRENTIAQISRISLDVNYAALLQHQPFLSAIDIRNAQVSLPLPKGADPNAPHAEIRNLHAHIYFPPEQIYVSQADGIFCGIRISATGQLIKRKDYQPSKDVSEEAWSKRMMLIQRIADELGKFTFPSDVPSIQVKFSGDLSRFETARAEATLHAERLLRGSYEIKNLAAAAEWSNQDLNITRCEWSDNSGRFSGRTSWSRESNTGDFQARSTLNTKQFLDAFGFGQILNDLSLTSPPLLELSGSGDFTSRVPRLKIIGRAVVENFTYKTVPFLKF